MSFLADAVHPGTSEAAWRTELSTRPPGRLVLADVPRAVVVAPHPDDEVLAVGGLLRHLHRRGTELVVVAVTDGEGSHTDQPALTVRAMREREVLAAYGALDIAPARHTLSLPDGAVAASEAALVDALRRVLRPDDLVLAPWEHDGHPDHDSAGRAALCAADDTGATLLAYPVWAWHWAQPGGRDLPMHRARLHPLDDVDLRAKAQAVVAFTSQLTPRTGPSPDPVLPAPVLARFARPFEVVLEP